MRHLYSLLFYLAIPAICIRLLWRARKSPAYATRWGERFGRVEKNFPQGTIWVHAVSVGEVLAAIPLIQRILEQYPIIPVVVTTMTPTGAERVKAILGDRVVQVYAPYDLPHAIKRFLRQIQPKIVVIMETELWPNLLHTCHRRNIPVFVANARLSARSAKSYAVFKRFTQQMLQCITLLAAQTQEDADRFIALGMPESGVKVTGNIKFDLKTPEDLDSCAQALRQQWGVQRSVWIAASTHAGEEEQLLAVFSALKAQFPELLLLLVPRHPERFAQVIALCRQHGLPTATRSDPQSCTSETQIFVGDSMGELLLFYAAADVAFVGGSFVATGGHNVLEPAALGLPVVIGPHTFNFSVITRQLVTAQAAWQVANPQELLTVLMTLLKDATLRDEAGKKGRKFVNQYRGALDLQLQMLSIAMLKSLPLEKRGIFKN